MRGSYNEWTRSRLLTGIASVEHEQAEQQAQPTQAVSGLERFSVRAGTLAILKCFEVVYPHGVILVLPVPYTARGACEREARKLRKAAISSTTALTTNVLWYPLASNSIPPMVEPNAIAS